MIVQAGIGNVERAGLGELLPWYEEHDAADIRCYSEVALAQLRAAALAALGPTNPFPTSPALSSRTGPR